MEILSSHRTADGALILKLSIDGEHRPYIYRADDPYRMEGLDDLVAELDFSTIPAEIIGPTTKIDLIAYAAQKRWEVETGGIILNGLEVHTDDRSKTLIAGARMGADNNPGFTAQFKSADGTFVMVDAPTVIAISDAVLTHVQNCFAIEDQVLSDIEHGTITTSAQVDAAFAYIAPI